MNKLLTIAAVVVATPLASLSAAMASEDVTLTATAQALEADGRHLTLVRKQGRYTLDDASMIRLNADLAAELDQGSSAERIVASELEIKDAGHGRPVTGAGLSGTAPVSRLATTGDFEFRIDGNGILAQNAAAACGSATGQGQHRPANMTVTVLWRVTTGRFTFSWVNYDRVAPPEGIKDNPDYYGDRQTHEKAIAVPLKLECRDDQAQAVVESKPAKANTNKPAAAKSRVSVSKADDEFKEPAQSTDKPAPRITVEPDKQSAQLVPAALEVDGASVVAAVRPVCEGGMIRETSADAGSFICLCPGNTSRMSTGANAFACEKRARR